MTGSKLPPWFHHGGFTTKFTEVVPSGMSEDSSNCTSTAVSLKDNNKICFIL